MRPKFYLTKARKAAIEAVCTAYYQRRCPPEGHYWGLNARMGTGMVIQNLRRYAKAYVRDHGTVPTGIHAVPMPNISTGEPRDHDFGAPCSSPRPPN